jgi:hypothetical protein
VAPPTHGDRSFPPPETAGQAWFGFYAFDGHDREHWVSRLTIDLTTGHAFVQE